MPDIEGLRVYIRYDILLTTELRAVLDGIERAYNGIDCLVRKTRRVRAEDRLRVISFHTGNSIETILKGAPSIIVGFAFLIHLLQKERHLYWETEKTKWDAKLAEQKLQQEINPEVGNQIHEALNNEDRNVMKALSSLRKMTQQISRSSNINSVEITFAPDDKRQDTTSRIPKRRITFPDNE